MKSLLPGLLAGLLVLTLAGCTKEAKKNRLLERAGKYYNAGDYEKAKIEYLNALQLDPEATVANERVGMISCDEGSPLRGIPYLAKARAQAPGNREARQKLMSALISIGKINEARREALVLLEKAPTNGEALVALSSTVRNKADLDVATREIEKFTEKNTPLFLVASSNLFLFKGDPSGMMDMLQRARRVDPDSVAVHSALGSLYARQNDREKALAEFKRAAELAPVRSPERVSYAEFLAQTGAVKEATTYLNDTISRAPDFLSPKILLARLRLADRDYDGTQALIKDIVSHDPLQLDAYILQSNVYQAKGDIPKAIEELTRVSKSVSGLGVINYNLARLYMISGQRDQAVTTLREGVAADQEHAESIMMLADLDTRAGHGEDAVRALTYLLQQRPTLIEAQLLLIDALHSSGHVEEAAGVVREQIKVYPNAPQPHVYLGKILVEQKKPAEARKSFERALELVPGHLPALNEITNLDIAERKFDAALKRTQDLKARMPQSAELCVVEARIDLAQEQWDKAEIAAQQALALDPMLPAAYDVILTTSGAGRTQQALALMDQMLQKNPQNQRALLVAGVVYGQAGKFDKAKESYEKLLAAYPNHAAALNNLACLYADQFGRLDAALELATKARTLEPESGALADTVGWIQFKRGNYDDALPLVKEGAKKLPDNPEMQYHLGMVSRMKGDNETARTALRIAANSKTNFAGKNEAAQELARLERGEPPAARPTPSSSAVPSPTAPKQK